MTARELVNRISLLGMVKQLGDRLTVGQRTLTPPVLVRIQVPQPPSIPPSLLAAKRLTSKIARAAQNVPREGVTIFASRAASDHG
jgi:hypothetical protein